MISGVWGYVTNKHLAGIPGTEILLNTQSYGRLHCLPICENTIIQSYIVKKVFVQSVKKWHFGEDKVFSFYYT